jgi:hypothetical protein
MVNTLMPGNTIGLPVILPASLPKATKQASRKCHGADEHTERNGNGRADGDGVDSTYGRVTKVSGDFCARDQRRRESTKSVEGCHQFGHSGHGHFACQDRTDGAADHEADNHLDRCQNLLNE